RAAAGDPARVALPAPMAHRGSLEFSFSGLKSAVARRVKESPPRDDQAIDDLCAAFQAVATQTLVDKTVRAARAEGVDTVVVAGGVAANRELRERMKRACDARGLSLYVPPFASCTDNAAMIAYAGALRLADGARDGLDLAPATFTVLPRRTRKGAGPRKGARTAQR